MNLFITMRRFTFSQGWTDQREPSGQLKWMFRFFVVDSCRDVPVREGSNSTVVLLPLLWFSSVNILWGERDPSSCDLHYSNSSVITGARVHLVALTSVQASPSASQRGQRHADPFLTSPSHQGNVVWVNKVPYWGRWQDKTHLPKTLSHYMRFNQAAGPLMFSFISPSVY